MPFRISPWLWLLLLMVSGAAVWRMVLPTQSPPMFRALLSYPQAKPLQPFELQADNGQSFNNEALHGQWNLVFLGYTYCPDICPTTLAELNRIYPVLTASVDLNVIFISVDPHRDSLARLSQYKGFFNSEFIAATAAHKQLFPMTRDLGMMYSIPSPEESQGDYLVNHSGAVVVIDPKGRLVGRFPPKIEPGKLALPNGDDITYDIKLLAEYSGS